MLSAGIMHISGNKQNPGFAAAGTKCMGITLVLVFIVSSAGIFSCTSSSQIPLSVREKQEEQQRTDTTLAFFEFVDQETGDEEELQRVEEMRKAVMEELDEEYHEQANTAITLYVNAQRAYVERNVTRALGLINNAIQLYEMADLYALKGMVHRARGEMDAAHENWEIAVSLDKEIVSEMYPGMKQWYENDYMP